MSEAVGWVRKDESWEMLSRHGIDINMIVS